MSKPEFVSNEELFYSFKSIVEECFLTKAQLPDQVFRPGFDNFSFDEFDWAMSGDFWPVLQSLCLSSGDDSCLIAVIDPDPVGYFKYNFDLFSWINISMDIDQRDYWDLLNKCPNDNKADSILANSEKVVWVPKSKSWAIWGERSSGLLVLGKKHLSEGGEWNGARWVLSSVAPNIFRNRIVPEEFEKKLLANFSR